MNAKRKSKLEALRRLKGAELRAAREALLNWHGHLVDALAKRGEGWKAVAAIIRAIDDVLEEC